MSERILRLQERICSLTPPLPRAAKELQSELRKMLIDAHNHGLLKTSIARIHQLLKLEQAAAGYAEITGGARNFKRLRELPHFERDDGAWFDFAITVAQKGRQPLELVAYDFEIRFDGKNPAFVRFDLNKPGHQNEAEGVRSHLHPGADDLSVPSPFMSPGEILTLLLHERFLRWPDKVRATSA